MMLYIHFIFALFFVAFVMFCFVILLSDEISYLAVKLTNFFINKFQLGKKLGNKNKDEDGDTNCN